MTNKLQYSLKLKVLTHVSVVHQLTEHEVINKITFSTIHDLPLLARLSTLGYFYQPLKTLLSSLLGNTFRNYVQCIL